MLPAIIEGANPRPSAYAKAMARSMLKTKVMAFYMRMLEESPRLKRKHHRLMRYLRMCARVPIRGRHRNYRSWA